MKCEQFSVKSKGFLCYTCRRGTKRMKQLEMMVKSNLDADEQLSKYTYYDQPMTCAPNIRRPDFAYILLDRIVILEVDEHAHRYYNRDCEIARVTELMEQAGAKPLTLIRFNPLKRLLGVMNDLLRRCFIRPLDGKLLEVEFIGYER